MFIYALSIFLTSTAFEDTKAKINAMRDKSIIVIVMLEILSYL